MYETVDSQIAQKQIKTKLRFTKQKISVSGHKSERMKLKFSRPIRFPKSQRRSRFTTHNSCNLIG